MCCKCNGCRVRQSLLSISRLPSKVHSAACFIPQSHHLRLSVLMHWKLTPLFQRFCFVMVILYCIKVDLSRSFFQLFHILFYNHQKQTRHFCIYFLLLLLYYRHRCVVFCIQIINIFLRIFRHLSRQCQHCN